MFLWSVGVSYPVCVPSHILAHPQPSHWGGSVGRVGRKQPWSCTSTAQQQPKHRHVFNIVLATYPKHSTVITAVKKVNLIPGQIQYTCKKHPRNKRFLPLKFHSQSFGNPFQLYHFRSVHYLHPHLVSKQRSLSKRKRSNTLKHETAEKKMNLITVSVQLKS